MNVHDRRMRVRVTAVLLEAGTSHALRWHICGKDGIGWIFHTAFRGGAAGTLVIGIRANGFAL
jgi:hypothetical protein